MEKLKELVAQLPKAIRLEVDEGDFCTIILRSGEMAGILERREYLFDSKFEAQIFVRGILLGIEIEKGLEK